MNDTRLALSDAQGLLVDLLAKLCGKEGWLWLEALKKFLRKENPWEKILRTIEIGTYSDVRALRQAIEASGAELGNWAGDVLNRTPLSKSKQFLNLVVLSVKELGFPDGAQLQDIYEAATCNWGLELCPAEVGPQLRLQYLDQPEGEWLIIAMNPICDSDGDPSLFYVRCDGGTRWLSARFGDPGGFWGASHRFVFVSR